MELLNQLLKEANTPFTARLKAELSLKSGNKVPAGTEFTFEFHNSGVRLHAPGLEKPIRLSYSLAHKYFDEFEKPPSIAKITRDEQQYGVCETPLGNRVEPDGHDEYGAPSWMLVMGVI
jgi:hypothetical protein